MVCWLHGGDQLVEASSVRTDMLLDVPVVQPRGTGVSPVEPSVCFKPSEEIQSMIADMCQLLRVLQRSCPLLRFATKPDQLAMLEGIACRLAHSCQVACPIKTRYVSGRCVLAASGFFGGEDRYKYTGADRILDPKVECVGVLNLWMLKNAPVLLDTVSRRMKSYRIVSSGPDSSRRAQHTR